MRTTLDLDQKLIEEAQSLTHIKEKTALIHEALKQLIAKAAQVELAKLAGTQKKLRPIRRNRSK